MISDTARSQLIALQTADEGEPSLRLELPLTLPSVANLREHHHAKARRVKMHRDAAWSAMRLRQFPRPAVVRIVRVAPRLLDSDNLASCAKGVRDGIADAMGIDDRDPCVAWVVDQEKGKAKVVIEVYRVRGA